MQQVIDSIAQDKRIKASNIRPELKRFFKVTITDKWIETDIGYFWGENHSEIASQLELKSQRVLNPRYREIEETGKYYLIKEENKGGKCFCFEIIN